MVYSPFFFYTLPLRGFRLLLCPFLLLTLEQLHSAAFIPRHYASSRIPALALLFLSCAAVRRCTGWGDGQRYAYQI